MPYIIGTFIFTIMSGVLCGAIWFTPPAKVLGETARVIYFHVPVAWISALAFSMSLWQSVQYLRTNNPEHDIRAEVSARLGLWFCVLATITGAVFAKAAWNMYWNWDPREVSITILLLVYMAYFGLRSAVSDPETRMRLAAVYDILASFAMPFLFFVVPRIYSSLHPDTVINSRGSNKILDHRMLLVFFAALIGFTLTYFWIYVLSIRVERLVRAREESDE
ncbi:MAG TPA: cytochrome c biogenesis protein [bacterium]|nr:cytochrome c biogenesis protein [bacterium]